MNNEIIATDTIELCTQLENAWTELSMWRDGEIVREEDAGDKNTENMWIETALELPGKQGEQTDVIMYSPEWATWIKGMVTRWENDELEWSVYDQQNDKYLVWSRPPKYWMRPVLPSNSNLPKKASRKTFDTPETDANCWKSSVREHAPELCYADFARKLELERDAVIAQNAEIFRNLGLPHGDMGALENYILNKK